MAKELKIAINHSRETLIEDALGAVCLVVILYGGLLLPSFF